MLTEQTRRTVLGDKVYGTASLQTRLRQDNAIDLLTPTRANACCLTPPALARLMAHFYQVIETLNSQLADHFAIERHQAKSLSGLCARIQAKRTVHTLGLFLNHQAHRLLGALKALTLL